MATKKEIVVIVGSGDIARYLTEEFLKDGTYDIVIISKTRREYFDNLKITFHEIKAYSKGVVTPLLDSIGATVMISTLQGADPVFYTTAHETLLHACSKSKTCKRFVSSEYMGNLRDFPFLPRGNYYARQPFRTTLTKQSDVKWTLVCQGWLADYFIQPADKSKSYMTPFPAGWPIDLDRTTVRITGTGDEPIGWTSARDMAKAVVKLIPHHDWPDHTYVFGELGTWNEAIAKYEKYFGLKLKRVHRTEEELQDALLQVDDRATWYTATMDEWSFLGGTAVPRDEALALREKYFKDVHFRTLEELFADSEKTQIL